MSSLYVVSAEAYTDICLKAVQSNSFSASEDREKKESRSLIEKRYVRNFDRTIIDIKFVILFIVCYTRLITLTYYHCAKAIYRKHRLPLALHMALSLNPVPDIEKNLLFDNVAIGNSDNGDLDLPEWIPDERREAVQVLSSSLPDVRKLNYYFTIFNKFVIL